jgi:hypothetical protein
MDQGSIFTRRANRRIDRSAGLAAACARAGIENLRPYDLSQTFAARLLEQGVHH